jgi:hypothetical protein
LVAQAYDSINVDDLAAFVGMSSSDTVQGKAFKKIQCTPSYKAICSEKVVIFLKETF